MSKVNAEHPGHALHGGNLRQLAEASGIPADNLLDASANLNPLGPPDWLDAIFSQSRIALTRYPDPEYRELRLAAAAELGVDPESIVFGNGADELMFALARCLAKITGTTSVQHLVPEPAYASYREAAESADFSVTSIQPAALDTGLASAPSGSAIWLGAPNNPDGRFYSLLITSKAEADDPVTSWLDWLDRQAMAHPALYFIIDEAFIDFVETVQPKGCLSLCSRYQNIIALRSMTKFWCIPGLRLGYLVWPAGARQVRRELPNWPLNCVAERFALYAFGADSGYKQRRNATLELLRSERSVIGKRLAGLSWLSFDFGMANFYLVRVQAQLGVADLAATLLQHGVAVRRCDNFAGLDQTSVRIAIRSPEENARILDALENLPVLATPTAPADSGQKQKPLPGRPKIRVPALMIQGCSSSAGKSLITAALCRIFRNRGYDVAPYKAQNMSLNSAVTPDGLEMGRAQAVQAAACGLAPDVRMNPVLLKPESDRGSQLVLMGKAVARYQAQKYYEQHQHMRETARAAYDSLAAEHQLIILEGAGSPAEINLKARDFVNMGAALHAQARVLLVGDIDRGGVFASFIGTVSTFTPAELRLFAGFLVNKFRGDPALLGAAFGMTQRRTNYPVLGCIPMLYGLNIPDEDEPVLKAGQDPAAALRLVVPKLRHVSNFTDLDAFAADSDVAVFAVSSASELLALQPDAVILPGSKSTVADLLWLRSTGLAEAIRDFGASGGAVVGICGGYQMMGQLIIDEQHTESAHSPVDGLGLLPLLTEFAAEKTLSPREATWLEGSIVLRGYEIHHGQTRPSDQPDGMACQPLVRSDDGRTLGYRVAQCWGSYLHGIFDSDDFRASFLNTLRRRKGLPERAATHSATLDGELDKLAAAVESAIDLPFIENLIKTERH